MAKSLVLGPILAPKRFQSILPELDVRHCYKLSLYAISKKTNEPSLRKWQKNQFLGPILTPWPKFWPRKVFQWNLPVLDVGHCCKLSLHANLRKTNEPNLKKHPKTVLDPIFFFSKFCLRQSLGTMISYCHVQYQKKLMIQF